MAFRILEYPESGLIFAFFVIFKLRIPDTGYSSIQYPVSAGLKTSLKADMKMKNLTSSMNNLSSNYGSVLVDTT